MSNVPPWMAWVVSACCGKLVAQSMPMALRLFAMISQDAFQSVQPVGVISLYGPRRLPSMV